MQCSDDISFDPSLLLHPRCPDPLLENPMVSNTKPPCEDDLLIQPKKAKAQNQITSKCLTKSHFPYTTLPLPLLHLLIQQQLNDNLRPLVFRMLHDGLD